MKVAVEWHKSPRQRYGIPRPPGSFSVIDKKLAEEILAVDPEFLTIQEEVKEKPVFVKDAMARKPRTRPVKREKED